MYGSDGPEPNPYRSHVSPYPHCGFCGDVLFLQPDPGMRYFCDTVCAEADQRSVFASLRGAV